MATNIKYLDPKADLTFKKVFGNHPDFTEEELRAHDKFWERVSSEKTLMQGRYDEGVQAGETTKALEIAKKMKAAGMEVGTICEMTGVKKEEIENI